MLRLNMAEACSTPAVEVMSESFVPTCTWENETNFNSRVQGVFGESWTRPLVKSSTILSRTLISDVVIAFTFNTANHIMVSVFLPSDVIPKA